MKWLNCQVNQGQFSDEYAIKGKLFNSKDFSMFVSCSYVKVDPPPEQGNPVNGLMQVSVLEEKDDLVLISLPGQSFENGYTVTVKKDQLKDNT